MKNEKRRRDMRAENFLKMIVLTSICFVIVFGSGEDSFSATATQKTLEDIQNQVIALRTEFKLRAQRAENDQMTVQEHLTAKLKDLLDKQQSTNASYPELTAKVNALKSVLDAYNDKIATFEQVVNTLETTLDANLATIETQFAALKQQGLQKVPAVSQKPGVTQPEPVLDFAPGQLFRAAYRIYMEGDYPTAIVGFQKYLEEYPNTQLAGSAQYWIAESFVKLEEYENALQEYDLLITKYPRDDKAPDAYYGKGSALVKLGKIEDAKSLFTYVIEHFPTTVAAKKAGERLEELR
jgi:tol-pal system protein YbgF